MKTSTGRLKGKHSAAMWRIKKWYAIIRYSNSGKGIASEGKRVKLYIVMIHMAKELYLSERPLGIDPIVKCIPNLLDCNLFFCLRVCCTTATRECQPPLLKFESKISYTQTHIDQQNLSIFIKPVRNNTLISYLHKQLEHYCISKNSPLCTPNSQNQNW